MSILHIWTTASGHGEVFIFMYILECVVFTQDKWILFVSIPSNLRLGRDHMWQIKTWQVIFYISINWQIILEKLRNYKTKSTQSNQDLYDNDLKRIVEFHMGMEGAREVFRNGQILGAEATLWAEKVKRHLLWPKSIVKFWLIWFYCVFEVDEHNMEMKLWPRSSAFAERMWTHPTNRTLSVYPRLLHHRERMVRRGVHADRLQPESCHQITGYCDDPNSSIWLSKVTNDIAANKGIQNVQGILWPYVGINYIIHSAILK